VDARATRFAPRPSLRRVGSVGEFYGAGGRGGGFGDGGSSASGGIGGAGDPNVAKLLDKLLAARWGAALAAAPAARPGGGGHATGPAAGEGVDLGDPLWRELPWGDYDADGSGCRLFRGTPPGTPLRVVVHAPAAGAAAGGAEDVMGKLLTGEPPGPRWVRNVRAIVPLESPDDSGADEAEFSGRLGAGARGVERFGRWAAKELKARGHIERTRKKRKVFEGVVVRDGRSGDVDYGPKRHGVVGDGARYAPLLA